MFYGLILAPLFFVHFPDKRLLYGARRSLARSFQRAIPSLKSPRVLWPDASPIASALPPGLA